MGATLFSHLTEWDVMILGATSGLSSSAELLPDQHGWASQQCHPTPRFCRENGPLSPPGLHDSRLPVVLFYRRPHFSKSRPG